MSAASISCCATASPRCMTFIATVIATGYLFVVIPKGFFPQQDTGILFGTTEAGQDVSFAEMYQLQQRAGAIVMADPAVDTMAMGLGAGVGNAAQNNGRMFITLKPRDERDVDAFQVIARLRPKLAQIPGCRVYLQAAQDVTVGARFARTQFQYTLQDANLDELNAWSSEDSRQAAVAAGIARRRDRPADCRHDADA